MTWKNKHLELQTIKYLATLLKRYNYIETIPSRKFHFLKCAFEHSAQYQSVHSWCYQQSSILSTHTHIHCLPLG